MGRDTDQAKIHDQAESAVKKAESGDRTGLTEQLNSMSTADRVAVAREMVKLNEQHRQSDDSLPKLEISTAGTARGETILVGVTEKEKRGWYNPARWVGDTHESSGTPVYVDGSRHVQYSPATGKAISEDVKYSDGSTEHYEFDPNTGKLESGDALGEHFEYYTGRLKSSEIKRPDGSTQHVDYDLNTGRMKSSEIKHPDGSTQHYEFDPNTRKLKSIESKDVDGSTMHVDYDLNTGRRKSSEIKWPDGSIDRTEFDPTTQKRKSRDRRNADGSTEHWQFDLKTGKEKS